MPLAGNPAALAQTLGEGWLEWCEKKLKEGKEVRVSALTIWFSCATENRVSAAADI